MENIQTRREKGANKERFEEEKECRLMMLYHRFLSVDDHGWDLVRQKLIHMKERYGSKQAVQLCPVCLCVFLSNSLKKHARISIGSLFLGFDPSQKTPKEVAQVFQAHGRIKKKKNGDILVGVPCFNQMCIPDHRSLAGSFIEKKQVQKDEKIQEFEVQTVDSSNMKKRPPQRETGRQIKSKSLRGKDKNNLWMPAGKRGIPSLLTNQGSHSKVSSFKNSRINKRTE